MTNALVQDMYETLIKYKQDIATSAQKCEKVSHLESTPSPSEASSSVAQSARHVGGQLVYATEQVETYLTQVRDNMVQWESVDKVKVELANWLMAKTREVQQLEQKPAKLHVDAAQMELSQLQVCFDSLTLSIKLNCCLALQCL